MAYKKKHDTNILSVSSVLLFIIMFGIAGLLHAFAAKLENEDSRESCAKTFADEWIKSHQGQTDKAIISALRSEFQIQTDGHDVPELLGAYAIKNICK